MLAISLMRIGAKGKPFYRLVVKEKRSKRDGKYLENVGTYNPMLDPAEVNLNHDRIQYWIGVGAQPTDTVSSLIKNNPVQTDEEKAASAEAKAAKAEAAKFAKANAEKVETEKRKADAEAAEKAKAEVDAAVKADEAAAAEVAAAEATETEAASVEGSDAEAPVAGKDDEAASA